MLFRQEYEQFATDIILGDIKGLIFLVVKI